MIQGIRVENGVFGAGAFDWASPFPVLCGLGVVTGYALLGATWLLLKTDGAVKEHARSQAKLLLFAVLALMAIVSLWTPLAFERIAQRYGMAVQSTWRICSLATSGHHPGSTGKLMRPMEWCRACALTNHLRV